MSLGEFPIELPPLLLRPAELLYRRGEIEEVDRDDRSSRTQIRIADECVELPPRLDQAVVNSSEPFGLFRVVSRAQFLSP